ncbi:MAG: ATP-grasp domain-containing protein, partial [Myxococcota bacterium]
AEFAAACEEAGLVFVGPPASAIRAMGDKAAAKARMQAAGVPVVPGTDGSLTDLDDAAVLRAAEEVGYPLLVKATAGGGGRGMRLVREASALVDAVASARREAESAFGDSAMIFEAFVEHARHVEIQVFADAHGTTLHLGERDCSTQRRRQKVIEEAPSPAVDPALRAQMGADAVRAAEAIGYRGAGTVEMILGADGRYFFLEMNTRLQVEHPVTELRRARTSWCGSSRSRPASHCRSRRTRWCGPGTPSKPGCTPRIPSRASNPRRDRCATSDPTGRRPGPGSASMQGCAKAMS